MHVDADGDGDRNGDLFPWGKWLGQTLGQRDDKEAPNTHEVAKAENTAG